MTEKKLTRRKFMAVGSAAIAAPIAAPILKNMAGMVPEANAAEKKAEKKYDFINKKECDMVVIGGGGSGLSGRARARPDRRGAPAHRPEARRARRSRAPGSHRPGGPIGTRLTGHSKGIGLGSVRDSRWATGTSHPKTGRTR